MKATYWQKGQSLDYTNGTNAIIEANTVLVIGSLIGIAGTDIEPGETGSVHVEGVFQMPKKDAAAIAMGAAVYWNASDGITTTASGNTLAGYAAEASAEGAETILVKLNK